MVVKIVKIVEDTDMRAIHKYRHSAEVARLPITGAVLYLNKKKTTARLIDSQKIVHTAYSGDGKEFSVQYLSKMMKLGLGISLSAEKKKFKIGYATKKKVHA